MRDSQSALRVWLTVSGSDCIASLAQRKSSSGSDTGSPQWAHHKVQSPSFSEQRESVCLGERNTKLFTQESLVKMKYIHRGICSYIRHKHTVLCQQSFPLYYHLKLNTSCNISLNSCSSPLNFLLSPSTLWPYCLYPPTPLQPYFSFNFHAVHQTD